MKIEVVIGSALGAACVLFLAWGAYMLLRRYRVWEGKQEERAYLQTMGKHWGLPMEPGEDPDQFRRRLTEHMHGQVRYPREPG